MDSKPTNILVVSVGVKAEKVANQQAPGGCWLFAALKSYTVEMLCNVVDGVQVN